MSMQSFVGRHVDTQPLIQEIARVKRTGSGALVCLSGRRSVGKSRLVQELCDASGLPYCFYQAVQRPRAEALVEFHEAVIQSTLPAADLFDGATYTAWPAALRAAIEGATKRSPVIIVIDELPYLTENDPGFASDLQKAWDRHLENKPVLLICVGSDVRMMDELVQERAPLHGRPTLEKVLQPLGPAAVGAITGAATADETLDRYLIVGGFPLLASRWAPGTTAAEFLEEALVDDHPFVTTALRILSSEFAKALSAQKVLEAIGHGETAHNKIGSRAGVSAKTLTDALEVLVGTKRIAEKCLPYAVPPGKKPPRYTVIDPYLRFWLRFVGPYLAEISRGRGDLTAARVMRDWSSYRGRAIEPVVRTALERMLLDKSLSKKLGGAAVVGSFWTRNHQVEVDLVGGNAPAPSRIGFVGSIKWHETEAFTAAERAALVAHRAEVPGAADARLVVVSRTGAEDGVEADLFLGSEDIVAALG